MMHISLYLHLYLHVYYLSLIAHPSGSERFTPEKADVSPKFSKPHSKERVVKEREREGGGGKLSVLQKWLRGDDKCHGEKRSSPGK